MAVFRATRAAKVNTVAAGEPANVSASLSGGVLHLGFDIPQGPPGLPGEVTTGQLDTAIAGTSNNSNGVATLGLAVSDPPTQGEMQALADKLEELINALRL